MHHSETYLGLRYINVGMINLNSVVSDPTASYKDKSISRFVGRLLGDCTSSECNSSVCGDGDR